MQTSDTGKLCAAGDLSLTVSHLAILRLAPVSGDGFHMYIHPYFLNIK